MKRLTLRILLAYLDDVLGPAETREVGQRLAESEAAQQLIARIKQVTRKRSITTPELTDPTGRVLDPNLVAEYLNNELPPEKAAELERQCLENDVYLAEVAACHQLMTLSAVESIQAPPIAMERMYGLVKGREAIASRRAAPAQRRPEFEGDGHAEEDEVLLLGLPSFGNTRWWAPVGIVAALAACLLLVLYFALGGRDPSGSPVAQNPPATTAPVRPPATTAPPTTSKPVPPEKPRIDARIATSWVGKPFEEAPEASKELGGSALFAMCTSWAAARPSVPFFLVIIDTQPEPITKPVDNTGFPPVVPPSAQVAVFGRHTSLDPKDSLLLRKVGETEWKRVLPREQVRTGELLVTLPGYRSQLLLNSQVELELIGNLPELSRNRVLESAVALHVPEGDFDIDMSLHRGRVVITGRADRATTLRLRFRDQTWDMRLREPGGRIALELLATFERGSRHPRTDVSLITLHGAAELRTAPGAALRKLGPSQFVLWDTDTPPQVFPLKEPAAWIKLPEKVPQEVTQATFSLQKGIAAQIINEEVQLPALKLALTESLTPTKSGLERQLALYTFAAIDELPDVIKALERADLRQVARQTLFCWLGRGAQQAERLRLALIKEEMTPNDADRALELFRGFPQVDLDRQAIEYLLDSMTHRSAAIRFLAFAELLEHIPGAAGAGFDAAGTAEARTKAIDMLRKQLLK
jgi:hypothetical protein